MKRATWQNRNQQKTGLHQIRKENTVMARLAGKGSAKAIAS